MTDLGRLLLLGRDYGRYGTMAATPVGGRGAAAISVGIDPATPGARFKTDRRFPNEDALCVIEADGWSGFAVADAHYGPEASHLFCERLHEIWSKVRPQGLEHLVEMVDFLRHGDPPMTESESTLLVTVLDRTTNEGYGVSYGDSTMLLVGPDTFPEPRNPRDMRFVNAGRRHSFAFPNEFRFTAEPGEVVLVFTDGIDECHYRSPETSVSYGHIAAVAAEVDYEPLALVTQLTELALSGVDGNPGGQDNIAVIASTV